MVIRPYQRLFALDRLSGGLFHCKGTMEKLQLFGAAVIFFGIGGLMVFYEWIRIKAGRPILKGRDVAQLYNITYLSMFVLGTTVMVAAIVR